MEASADPNGSQEAPRARNPGHAGVQMPVGYEFGFRKALDVVGTRPSDWEPPSFDLTPFLRRVNALKASHPLLATEGVLRCLPVAASDVTALARWSDEAGTHRGVLLVNRCVDAHREVQVGADEVPARPRLFRPCRDDAPAGGETPPTTIRLAPAEVAVVMEAV